MSTAYQEHLRSPKWQKKRLKILERDNFTCILCGDTESTLHVHHEKYNGNYWEANDGDLKTLCLHCHSLIEHNKTQSSWKGEAFLKKIIKLHRQRGNSILMVTVSEVTGDGDLYIGYHLYIYENNAIQYCTGLSKETLIELNDKLKCLDI